MKFEAINRRYNELVAEYMNKGYYVNTNTMSGHQGEIAKIDLTNGDEIIRILIEHHTDIVGDYSCLDCVQIIVGRNTDTRVLPNKDRCFDTIWNDRLEVLHLEKWYEVGRNNDGSSWYGTKEECLAKWAKHNERYNNRVVDRDKKFSDDAKKVVLSYLKRQPKCKSLKVSDIDSVTKIYRKNSWTGNIISIQYLVTAKGKTYTLR